MVNHMAPTDPSDLEPVQDDAVSVVRAGLGIWLAAGVLCVLLRDRLAANGTQWWILTCAVGLILGIVMLLMFTRRAQRRAVGGRPEGSGADRPNPDTR